MARLHYSPAALALMARGVTVSSIAKALGVHPPAVTRWLRGEHPAPEALYVVVAAFGDHDLAEHVRQLVADAQPDQPARPRQARQLVAVAKADERQARRHAAAAQADQRQSVAS